MVKVGIGMKVRKGAAGYIHAQKIRCGIKTGLEFALVLALFVLGIVQTGSRLNLLTVVAILGCLPASKSLVGFIMILPHGSVSEETVKELNQCAGNLTIVYDMVFTSEKKIMPVDSIVISDNTICGYTSRRKVNVNEVSAHIKKYLDANKFTKVSVKIFDNYEAYVKRIEDMNLIASADVEIKEKEMTIRQVILNLSL